MQNRVILYGDISPNVIDGSSIWLISIAETLSRIFDEVHVILKMKPTNNELLAPLVGKENITLHTPGEARAEIILSVEEASRKIGDLVTTLSAQAVVARGFEACNILCQNPVVAPVLWSYVTDLPFPPERISSNSLNRLKRVSDRSYRLFAQTEAARSYLESLAPSAAGRTYILNPMVPDSAFVDPTDTTSDSAEPLKIVYSGKFAREWKTLEMLELPRELRKLGVASKLIVVGNKFNRASDDPSWVGRMQEALAHHSSSEDRNVEWLGSLPRSESIAVISSADLGLGWRTSSLDSSLEISTKALEYGATGTPPIINRTADHVALYGEDYPYFVSASADVKELACTLAERMNDYKSAVSVSHRVSEWYSLSRSAERLRCSMGRAGALQASEGNLEIDRTIKNKVLIVSHDFKFMGELSSALHSDPAFEIKLDEWDSLHKHDAVKSKEFLAWADTIFCEFAGPSLAWYSKHKRPGTKLVSRLHGFEIRGGKWLEDVRWQEVDDMIFVSEHYRQLAVERLGLSAGRTHVIPNTIDVADFKRPKLPSARFHVGIVGFVPFLKRPDRAVSVLQRLLVSDDRFTLHMKGRQPWDYPYVWKDRIQRQMYLEMYSRIAQNQSLRRHIVFDDFGADVASWQRNVGFVLSTSENESFHLAPAEGMASGSIPVVWKRPGSAEVFGSDTVVASPEEAASRILEWSTPGIFEERSKEMIERSKRWDVTEVTERWKVILKR